VGEVFVRNAGGVWKNIDETSLKGGSRFPIVVELSNGVVCNPIGKVFKRLVNGSGDGLPFFYQLNAELLK
jgi:hypothetical protein